ncbi:MAG: B-box zinc finger protein [Candidatus Bathyarchaeia archaeon]
MVTCPICNVENPYNTAFCLHCGNPLAAAVPTVKAMPAPLSFGYPSLGRIGMPTRAVRVGSCFYHPDLPAVYICNRCGKAICRDCTKSYGGLILCPPCSAMVPKPTMIPRLAPVYQTFSAFR